MTVYPDADAASMNYIFQQPAPARSVARQVARRMIDLRLELIEFDIDACIRTLSSDEQPAFKIGYCRSGFHQLRQDIQVIRDRIERLDCAADTELQSGADA